MESVTETRGDRWRGMTLSGGGRWLVVVDIIFQLRGVFGLAVSSRSGRARRKGASTKAKGTITGLL